MWPKRKLFQLYVSTPKLLKYLTIMNDAFSKPWTLVGDPWYCVCAMCERGWRHTTQWLVSHLCLIITLNSCVSSLQIQVSYYPPGQYPSSGQQYRVPQPMAHQVSYPAQRTQPMPQPTQQSGRYLLLCCAVVNSIQDRYLHIFLISVFLVH